MLRALKIHLKTQLRRRVTWLLHSIRDSGLSLDGVISIFSSKK